MSDLVGFFRDIVGDGLARLDFLKLDGNEKLDSFKLTSEEIADIKSKDAGRIAGVLEKLSAAEREDLCELLELSQGSSLELLAGSLVARLSGVGAIEIGKSADQQVANLIDQIRVEGDREG